MVCGFDLREVFENLAFDAAENAARNLQLMSALGQKRTCKRAGGISASPPRADICGGGVYVR
jgi:hypothetical protein